MTPAKAHITLRSLEDIERFEQSQPFDTRCRARTVYDVFCEAAARFPSNIALTMISTGELDEVPPELAYSSLLNGITRAANFFADLAGAGCGVAYMLPNLVETHLVLWGAETAGYAVPINYLLQAEHIVELLRAADVKVLVALGTDPHFDIWKKALEVSARLPSLLLVRLGGADGQASGQALDLLTALEQYDADKLAFNTHFPDSHIAGYFHTGGTTGAPRLAAHTHRNQIVAAFGGKVLLDYRETDRLAVGLPLFHVAATISCGLSAFMAGANVIILSPAGMRNPAMVNNFWNIISRFGATIVTGVPTVMSTLLNVPIGAADISSLRYAITGAAPAPRSVMEQYEAKIKRPVREIFGMTECGGLIAATPAAGDRVIGSVGYRLPYIDVSIRKSDVNGTLGDVCAPHEIGILAVSGPVVTPGYLKEGMTIEPVQQSLFNSGDLAYADESGRIYIAGREKDLIIRSGHNIDPELIENVLQQHSAVAMAAAIGQPDGYAGEVPVCYVTPKPGAAISVGELRAFAEARIAERPAWPKEYYVIDTMPTTSVGKIFKPSLRADATHRLVSQIIDSIIGNCDATINVTMGGKRGIDVVVTLAEISGSKIQALDAALGAFTFEHRVQVNP